MAALLDRQRRPGPTGEMPFLDHLEELRWRILWSLLALIVGSGLGIWLVMKYNVLNLLIAPIQPYLETGRLMYLSPSDPFFLTLRLGLTAGFILASPIVFYQIWAFVSPALLPQEKKAIVPALYLGLVLFAFGVVLAYMYALPMTLKFFMTNFQTEALQANIIAPTYLGLVVKLLLAFGAIFELPVVVLVLSAMGLVTSQFLREKRRYAIAGLTILAAMISPGDAITVTLLMMVPLILLYEMSIGLARMVEKQRERSQAAAAEAA
ncbi:MAG: twin-arginine translocase subunit TatC [Longimicrobiales bacterium]